MGLHSHAHIFFSGRPNPVQEAVLDQWGITMITSNIDELGKALTEFLEGFVWAIPLGISTPLSAHIEPE